MKCKECGKKVNEKAEICPYCGCRIKQNKLVIFALILVSLVVLPWIGIMSAKGINMLKERKRERLRNNYDGTIWKLEKNSFSITTTYNNTTYRTFFPQYFQLTRKQIPTKCTEKDEKCLLNYDYYNVVTVYFEIYNEEQNNITDERIVCFEHIKNQLIQTACPEDEISDDKEFINELPKHNIIYTKVEE